MKTLASFLLGMLLASFLAFTFGGEGSPFVIGESVSADNMNEIDTALDDLQAGTSIAAAITRDTEWDTEGEVQTAWGSVNIILETQMDASTELLALMDDETGTGALVFATSPTLVTPALGTPASGVMTNVTGTAASLTAGAATALAANGANCSSGTFPLGVSAAGVSENCTDAGTQAELDAKSAATSTDTAIPRFSGTSGDLQDSGCTIDGSGNQTCAGDANFGTSGATFLMFRDSTNAAYKECAVVTNTFTCATDADGVIDGTL